MLQTTRSHLARATIALATLSTFTTLPAAGQTINEDFKLITSDGLPNGLFGYSIAISKGVVAVGAFSDDENGNNSGSAYLFDASTGAQLFKLLASDGADGDFFGLSIAINKGIVAVGAQNDSDNGFRSGSAYLFDASTGEELFKLLPTDGQTGDSFGFSTSINNTIAAVGSILGGDNGIGSGSVYLFEATTGMQTAKLLPDDGAANDQFGHSIAIDNSIIAIGAINANNAAGAASLFDASTGDYLADLIPTDGKANNQFGNSIAISNNIVAAGAWHDDDNGTDSGSIYIFDTNSAPTCPADLTADGSLDFFDIAAFLTLFSSGDLAADFTNDAQLDFFDISAFLTAFSAGCP